MVITFITKRALFPFSPWLPLAIAAPTPISALVHSSTLVTSGLYLIMRYSYFLYSNVSLLKFLVVLSIFTSFYAGLNSLFEVDFKKLIALSTLSHLGFIGLSFSLGLLSLAYFHMLTHALFKSLLFICMGDIMINLNHAQDSRYLSCGYVFTPASVYIINVSLINLLGLPNLRGFYSKDLVLEVLGFTNGSFFFCFMISINIFFTFFYTFKLLYFSFQSLKLIPFQIFHLPSAIHFFLLFFIAFITLLFGKFFLLANLSFTLFTPVVSILKFFPIFLSFLFFLFLYFCLQFPSRTHKFSFYIFSNILYLTNLCIRFSSHFYLN
jgi:NADH-ubiquinone oxidoreductase chain 5